MKLTATKFVFVSFVVFLSCFLYGCQSKNTKRSSDSSITETALNSSISKENSGKEEKNSDISSMAVGDQLVLRNYVLYVMNVGKIECTKEIQEYTEDQVNLDDVYQELLEELTSYIGYEVDFNSVVVSSEQVKIDLNESSDLFHKEEYNAAIVEPVKYADYEDMVFGILDSMKMTIQENHGSDINVVYTEDGDAMELPEVSLDVEFSKEEAYQGWDYYKNMNLTRAEGKITSFVDLGMSYNEVLICLNEQEIKTTQEEEFSMLGDNSSWETYNDVDEYLRNAWLHISLYSDSYTFEFDGADSTLMGILVTNKELPSSRGLLVGDHLKRLMDLYGNDYTMYVIEGSLLYEYQLENCYFRAFVDATEEYILSYGVASYSQAEVIRGQEILDEVKYKQERKKALDETENSGRE